MRPMILLLLPALMALPAKETYGAASSDTDKCACLQNAGKLLEEALAFMQRNYYRKDDVSWIPLISEARARIGASATCEEAYATIDWCFQRLNEPHSFLMPAPRAAVYNNDSARLQQVPALSLVVGEIAGEWPANGIAYLKVPWVRTTDSLVCMHIADSLQHWIARLDAPGVSKWIVDLRQNTGGNCWPMLAGIGPLLGNGICGYFVNGEERIPIGYQDGNAFQGRNSRCRVSRAYQTRANQKWIVVLTGSRTISAGEIVALAFKGRKQVYLCGEPTAGLTTANATYELSDHSMLVLTVCREADQTGKICEGKIFPDETVAAGAGGAEKDPVKSAAIRWLQTQ